MTKELEQDILYQAKVILDKIKSAPEDYKNNPMTQNLMKWYEALIDTVTAEPQESDESLNKRMPALQNKLLGSSSSDDEDDEDLEDDDFAGESILGELTPTNTENLYTEEDMQKHFGEGQAEGLDNLLEGLRDTPHDNRW